MRFVLALLAALMFALPAIAQTTDKPIRTRLTMQQRFEQANITNDGQLTLEQARAKYPGIAKRFTAIDLDQKGYITLDDIRAYNKVQRTLHRRSADTRRTPNG